MLAKVLAFIATLCYPFVIWLGLQHFGLAFLALFLLAIAVLRLYSHRDRTSLTIFGHSERHFTLAKSTSPIKALPCHHESYDAWSIL